MGAVSNGGWCPRSKASFHRSVGPASGVGGGADGRMRPRSRQASRSMRAVAAQAHWPSARRRRAEIHLRRLSRRTLYSHWSTIGVPQMPHFGSASSGQCGVHHGEESPEAWIAHICKSRHPLINAMLRRYRFLNRNLIFHNFEVLVGCCFFLLRISLFLIR